jgi:hypothetical protein
MEKMREEKEPDFRIPHKSDIIYHDSDLEEMKRESAIRKAPLY